jgi:hypothetical protein
MMNRRTFITAVGGSIIAEPLAATVRQSDPRGQLLRLAPVC